MTAPHENAGTTAANGAGVTPHGVVRLIARREIVTRARERSFMISTVITILIVVGIIVIPHLLSGGPDRVKIGLVGAAAEPLQPALEVAARQNGAELEVRRFTDAAAARTAVDSDDIDAAFVGADRVVVADELDGTLASVVQSGYRQVASAERLTEAGLDPARVADALSIPPLAVDALEGEGSGQATRRNTAFFGIVLLYGQLIGYSLWVAMGVTEEKASRIVELLLATVRPWQLLTGKIIGIGLLALGQLLVMGVAGLAAAVGSGVIEAPGEIVGVLGQVLVWFLLGYAFYSCAYAAAAALVVRQEELQNITGPLTILLVGSFFLGVIVQQDPDGAFSRVVSLVPPLSALTMPVRWAGGDAGWWELGLAVLLMVLATVGLVRLAAWVYAGAVLRPGPKVKVREALAAGRRSSG